MTISKLAPLAASLLVATALTACGGAAAVEDLQKLKDKTCSCKEDAACIDEAKKMASDWVSKHKDARGGDQEKATTLIKELMECNMDVGFTLAGEAAKAVK